LPLGGVIVKGTHRKKNKNKKWGEKQLSGGNKCGVRVPFPRL
jgi:hypothetical protein